MAESLISEKDALRLLVREEVANGIKDAFGEECTRPCGRVRSLQKVNWVILASFVTVIAGYIGTHI